MKKLFGILGVFMLLALAGGCAKKQSAPTQPPAGATAPGPMQTAPETAPAGQ